MADQVIQNALQLRYFAEEASGLRGALRNVFVEEVDGHPLMSIVPAAVRSDFLPAPYMELDTRYQQPHRAVPEVTISAEGETMSLAAYDAVFWSEAAVEKFVLPYYASKSLWLAAYVLAGLSRHWYGFIPGVDRAPEPAGAALEGEAPVPFALAHLPTSDYVTLGDEVPGADLHLLYRQPDGSVRARSLAELLRAEREAAGQNG